MAFTLEQLTALEAAIAQGTKSVTYADKTVTYHSLDEMMRLRKAMQQDLAAGKKSRTKAVFNKDLGAKQNFEAGGSGDLYINAV